MASTNFMQSWIPLSRRSTAEIRAQALDYRCMAATARTGEAARGLQKIALRLDRLADSREREPTSDAEPALETELVRLKR